MRLRSSPSSDALGPGHLRTTARILIACALCLLVLGLVMQFSVGIGRANPFYHLAKQAVFAGIGIGGAMVAARMPYQIWRDWLKWLFPLAVILLVMVRLVGPEINGSHRWLFVGPFTLQPSEVGKLAVILWLAASLAAVPRHSHEFKRGFLVPSIGLGLICALVIVEPDLGTTMLIAGVGMTIMFLAGTQIFYLLLLSLMALGGVTVLLMHDPERMSRITSFLDPMRYEQEESYQLVQSLFAFVSGGGDGVGFGQSALKHSYLPEAHTDFILAIIAEEFGVGGPLVILVLFLTIFLCGLRIGWYAHDAFGRFVAYGITFMVGMQAAINIGVVTGSLPTKGLPLPFVSYGGSSLVMTCVMTGILISIAHHNSFDVIEKKRKPVKDSRHWV